MTQIQHLTVHFLSSNPQSINDQRACDLQFQLVVHNQGRNNTMRKGFLCRLLSIELLWADGSAVPTEFLAFVRLLDRRFHLGIH